MGQAKREWEQMLARGFREIGDKFVCEACFGDEAIKDFIRQHAKPKRCDYCGQDSEHTDARAVPIDEVMPIIFEGLEAEWADPTEDGVSWISSEGGWQSLVYDTRELFIDYMKDELGTVADKMLDHVAVI